MRFRRALAAAALAAAALLPAPAASSGEGFLGRATLFPIAFAGQDLATGGVTAWFRIRNDRSSVQGLRVWVRGLEDAFGDPVTEGVTLWMAAPGDVETREVGDLASSENGSAYFEVVVDSRYDNGAEIPLGLESMVRLERATFEIRVVDASLEDVPVLRGRILDFHFRNIVLRDGAPGTRGRAGRLVRPPAPEIPPDDLAVGRARLWRRGRGLDARMGIALFARGLTADETYEVWLEDEFGDLQDAGELESTADGLGYWSVDTGTGEDLPDEADDDVRNLSRRRVELRRSGFTTPSLVGILPRLR